MKNTYQVFGMGCSACVTRVENAVKPKKGVKSVQVSLLTNSMVVEGDIRPEDVMEAVKKAGYEAVLVTEENTVLSSGKSAKSKISKEQADLFQRFLFSLILFLLLFYISMGHSMWNFPLPEILTESNPKFRALTEGTLAFLILLIHRRFFIHAVKALFHKSLTMDTLVACGSFAAFIYSFFHPEFFESSAMIPVVVTLGKLFESFSKSRTSDAIDDLKKLVPDTVTVFDESGETIRPLSEISVGDRIFVRPGERIPADGIITDGKASCDESMMSGESIPVDKEAGDSVFAGTMNLNGRLVVKVTALPEDSLIASVIRSVKESALTKAPIEKLADRIAGIFVPIVIGISLITFFAQWLVKGDVSAAFLYAISVLVVSCPCALGLATPVAVMVGNGLSAKHGILFKNAEVMEEAAKIKILAFDKTGTLTTGNIRVSHMEDLTDSGRLIKIAGLLERNSNHPLAKAIAAFSGSQNFDGEIVDNFEETAGNGVSGLLKGKRIFGGKESFAETFAEIPGSLKDCAESYLQNGSTVLYFGEENKIAGFFALSDTIREDAPETVTALKKMGIRPVLLSGDRKKVVSHVSKELGIDEFYADILPTEKAEILKKLKSSLSTNERIGMVGDGINDAPSLALSDIGIAMSNGSNVAMDAGNIVLVHDQMKSVKTAVSLSRRIRLTIKENLFWAFFYNLIMIPLAAGLWEPLFGLTISPMISSLAMSLSSVTVVLNALRMNRWKEK